MSLHDWISNTGSRIRRDGWLGIKDSGYMIYTGAWRLVGSRLPIGTNVFEHDWDILVLLDGCRVDSLQEIATAFDFPGPVDELVSKGSTSREWLAKTFVPEFAEEISSTTYVTANPYSDEILSVGGGETRSPFNPANWDSISVEELYHIEEVWRDGWDESLGTVHPRTVTDRAVKVAREQKPERLIVHYMQPHQPFIGQQARLNGNSWKEENCWRMLRLMQADVDEVRAAYRENLQLVLQEVELLLRNIDGEAVISSDHGNAFGEWGIYGHPNGFLHPSVKHVPWLEVTATDTGEYQPENESAPAGEACVNVSTEQRLRDLGYL